MIMNCDLISIVIDIIIMIQFYLIIYCL